MKTLPCAVVRDLLPSYIENLTEEETTAAVRQHLEACGDCRACYEKMTEGNQTPEEDLQEVDYLNTVRRRNRKKVVIAAAAAVLLAAAALLIFVFLIGTPVTPESAAAEVTPGAMENSLTVTFFSTDSARALKNIRVTTKNGVVEITARKVLASRLYPSGDAAVPIDLKGVRQINAFGEPLWQDGVKLDYHTRRLFKNRTEYVGNASAVDRLICSMDLDAPHTLELQTKEAPYGVTIHFTDAIAENRRFLLEGNAAVLLALIDNLGEVTWDTPDGYRDSLTLQEVEGRLAELTEAYNESHGTGLPVFGSLKDYGTEPYRLQVLRNILGV